MGAYSYTMEVFLACVVSILCFSLVTGHACEPGWYGPSCNEQCGHCMGGHSYCNPGTGTCRDGCTSGYLGDKCHVSCPKGSYGLSCTKTCSDKCLKQECDPTNGVCAVGCVPGYMGDSCSEECPAGKYGPGCVHECRCREGCMCDPDYGKCLKKGCTPKTKKKRVKRQAKPARPITGKGGGLMCSKMQSSFNSLQKKLSQRVTVPLWPMYYLMGLASVIIVLVGIFQMVADFRREMYVRKWERENILQPLQIRAKMDEEELKKRIAQLDEDEKQKSSGCTIS